ncbi:MAG: hypothetical protein KKA90_04950 [Nanoarchaeota archaeon]|nr:hypothetical protein [Nanoarchaeota archaeon]
MRLGQTEAASVILITGIVLALIAVSYFWGAPLINKQTASSDIALGTRFMRDLADQITDLANAGSGSFSVAIPLGSMKVIAYDAGDPKYDNTIWLQLPSTTAPLFKEGTLYLDAVSYSDIVNGVGVHGSASHNILSATTAEHGSGYIISIINKEIQLITVGTAVPKGFVIRLLGPSPSDTIAYGKNRATFSVVSIETFPLAAANGGDLFVTNIRVTLG